MVFSWAEKLGSNRNWAHARRELFEAEAADPERARIVLEYIAEIYAVEERIREPGLQGEAKRDQRVLETKPKVEALFAFVDAAFAELGLLPATPFTKHSATCASARTHSRCSSRTPRSRSTQTTSPDCTALTAEKLFSSSFALLNLRPWTLVARNHNIVSKMNLLV